MRVIGGELRGRKLKALEGQATRPTLDRVKEAMFSMAQPWLYNSAVLDLFGGSGALAIEAVSRGAKSAWINDNSKQAVKVIDDNIKSIGIEDLVTITNSDWQGAIKTALRKEQFFDIIFLDPPYDNDYIYSCAAKCFDVLKKDGVIIVEHDENTVFEKGVIKQKRYGKVYVTFLGADL